MHALNINKYLISNLHSQHNQLLLFSSTFLKITKLNPFNHNFRTLPAIINFSNPELSPHLNNKSPTKSSI